MMDLKEIIEKHRLWVIGEGGECANLRYAYLMCANLSDANMRSANLSGANLSDANLSGADLRDANLIGANLSGANLRYANMRSANLSGANLRYANMRSANLSGANLSGAYLMGAHLSDAHLIGADLDGVDIAEFRIVPEIGEFTAFKSVHDSVLGRREAITIRIPEGAKRVNAIGSRKCRASAIEVIDAPPGGFYRSPTYVEKAEIYFLGKIIEVPDFCDDVRIECAPGIHFFMTREEAEAW